MEFQMTCVVMFQETDRRRGSSESQNYSQPLVLATLATSDTRTSAINNSRHYYCMWIRKLNNKTSTRSNHGTGPLAKLDKGKWMISS